MVVENGFPNRPFLPQGEHMLGMVLGAIGFTLCIINIIRFIKKGDVK
jgi:hypothetical protein